MAKEKRMAWCHGKSSSLSVSQQHAGVVELDEKGAKEGGKSHHEGEDHRGHGPQILGHVVQFVAALNIDLMCCWLVEVPDEEVDNLTGGTSC